MMDSKILIFMSSVITIGLSLDPIVELPNGKIQGREASTYKNKVYYAFEKIPFAEPPIGNLRFKAPVPPQIWDGTLNTTHLDIACYQLGSSQVQQSEDCLFLNVYTPLITSENNDLLPVMVYIYGGGYTAGYSFQYQPDLFIGEDVILVTLNYRLGIFGFLSTEDEIIPGNNALKDQLLALQWVHDNINLFGGDPTKVVLFGQSAGAGSSAYHTLNQNSLGLFSGAILESGTCLNQASFQRNPRKIAFAVGAILNSTFETNEDSELLLDFLQTVDADILNAAVEEYDRSVSHSWDYVAGQQLFWAPVIEVKNPTAFITKKMYGLLQAGNVLEVPVMMGFTSGECIAGLSDPKGLAETLLLIDEHLEYLVPDDMLIVDVKNRTKMGTEIRNIYTNGEDLVDDLGAIIYYCGDDRTTRPMIKHAEFISNIVPTYFYQFSYDGVTGGIDIHYDGIGNVGHAEELKYLFCGREECNDSTIPKADLLTRQRLIKLWTNFAKYGNPTPEPSELLQNVTWPQLEIQNGDFLYLDIGENLEIKKNPREEPYIAWNKLYDSLDFNDFDVY